jgi:hypothetical protein
MGKKTHFYCRAEIGVNSGSFFAAFAIAKPSKSPRCQHNGQYAKNECKQPKDYYVNPAKPDHLTPFILYRGLA